MKFKRIIAALAVTGMMASASAQEESSELNPWFVQGGLGLSYSVGGGAGLGEMLAPAGQITVGKFFNPYLGARVAFGGWLGRYHIPQSTCTGFYHFNAALDGLWNMTATFGRSYDRPVDLSLIVGVGYDRSFARPASSLLVRTGLMMSVRLCKAIDFNVEYTANGVSDRWNSLDDHSFDTWMNLLVGVTYKFGTGYGCPTCVDPVKYDNEAVNAMRREVEVREIVKHDTVTVTREVPAKVEAVRGISSHVVFQLAKTNIEPSQEMNVISVADYMKANPKAVATVTGYADKGTGSREINLRLAKERADAVASMLEKKYGIAASRITVTSMHDQDTQQPFERNDWNRVVILTADVK